MVRHLSPYIEIRVIWGFLILCEKNKQGVFKQKRPEFHRRYEEKLYSQYFTCIFNIYILFQLVRFVEQFKRYGEL